VPTWGFVLPGVAVVSDSVQEPLHEVPIERRSRRREWIARLRGEQTLERMRRAGLCAPDPIYVGARVHVDAMFAWAITIGAHTRIAHDVLIVAHDAAIKHLTGYTEVRPVVIGAGCYIGAGSIVLPDARIGDGAVIGAGSIVRGEIPAGVIAVGNPAKVIGLASELRERHAQWQAMLRPLDKRPIDGLTASERMQIRATLAEHGRVYVR
jgi:carbonic anhydrase/acetyltransferase-like protein (isoleucine patch superfamily)